MFCDVLVTGTFNVLHAGHVELLEFASQFGEVTVGLNGDRYQVAKYGDLAIPLQSRASVLRACRYVANVVHFDEDDPSELVYRLKPNVFVRGPDYAGKDLPELEALQDVGARIIIHHADKLYSGEEVTQILKATKGFDKWTNSP